jgi:hypothetical protein
MGLTLAARSCSLLKVDPQVLQRHPVIGVLAALTTPIREGLNDRPISPPHCRHRCLDTRPLSQFAWEELPGLPVLGKKHPGWGVQLQSTGDLRFRLAIPARSIAALNCRTSDALMESRREGALERMPAAAVLEPRVPPATRDALAGSPPLPVIERTGSSQMP